MPQEMAPVLQLEVFEKKHHRYVVVLLSPLKHKSRHKECSGHFDIGFRFCFRLAAPGSASELASAMSRCCVCLCPTAHRTEGKTKRNERTKSSEIWRMPYMFMCCFHSTVAFVFVLLCGPEICQEATRYLSATRGNHQKALSLMEALWAVSQCFNVWPSERSGVAWLSFPNCFLIVLLAQFLQEKSVGVQCLKDGWMASNC